MVNTRSTCTGPASYPRFAGLVSDEGELRYDCSVRSVPLVLALVASSGCGVGEVTQAEQDVPGGDGGVTAGNPDASIGAGPHAAELAFCLDETNRYRAMNGVPALAHSDALQEFAMVAAEVDHQSQSPHKHFADTLGGGVACAENEVPRWSIQQNGSVRAIVELGLALMWSEGPGGPHYENIVGPYDSLGCGIYVDGDLVTVVQDFGNANGSCPPP